MGICMKPLTIKSKVTLIATSVFVALLVVASAIQMYFVKVDMKELLGNQQLSTVSYEAQDIDHELITAQTALVRVSMEIPPVIVYNTRQLEEVLANAAILRLFFDDILVQSPKGEIIFDLPARGRRGANVFDLENFQTTLKTRKPYISKPLRGRTTGRPFVLITAPILNESDEVVAVLTGGMNLLKPNFLGNLSKARVGKTGSFELVTRDRVIVMSPATDRIMTQGPAPGVSPSFDHATMGREGWEESINSDGVHAVVSYEPLQSVPWVLEGYLPVAEAYAPIANAQHRIATVTLVLALLLAPMVWFATRYILAPLAKLRDTIRRIRDGPDTIHEVAVMTRDEIGDLAVDFNAMMRKQKLAEAALRASEEMFRTTFEQAPMGLLHRALDGSWARVNRKMSDITGYTCEEIIAHPRFRLTHPDDFAETFRLERELMEGRVAVYAQEKRWVRKDGAAVWVHVTASLVRKPSGEPDYRIVVAQDISDRKRAEERLRMLSRAVEQSPTSIFITDNAGNIEYVNPRFEEVTGYSKDEVIGRNPRILKSGRNPLSQYADLWKTIAAGGEWRGELCNRKKSGELFWEFVSASGLVDEAGNIAHFVAVKEDITARKQLEAEILALNEGLERRVAERTAQLERANEELDAFSYSISHDLRAPLRAINGFASILSGGKIGELGLDRKELLTRIARNAQRMGEMVDDLLEFSRAGRAGLNLKAVDLNPLVAEVVATARANHPATAVDVAPLPGVTGDRNLLRQVFENLIANAFKFSAKAEAPQIEIGAQPAAGETIFFVRDNGAGFDMAHADKLFTVFQRLHTETEFPGTGVGLAIIKRVIERHGGRVWAESAPDAGAVFYFTINCG